jgi:hypothetical protein
VFRAVDDPGLIPSIPGLVFRRERDRATRIEAYQFAFERIGPLDEPRTLFGIGLLALVALIGTLMRLRFRGRSISETRTQRLAGALQTLAAVAWLTAAGAAAFALSEADLLYTWPNLAVLTSSSAALVATLLSAGAILLLPMVWRGRLDTVGWTWWRKLRFTLATTTFVVFGSVLVLWVLCSPGIHKTAISSAPRTVEKSAS